MITLAPAQAMTSTPCSQSVQQRTSEQEAAADFLWAEQEQYEPLDLLVHETEQDEASVEFSHALEALSSHPLLQAQPHPQSQAGVDGEAAHESAQGLETAESTHPQLMTPFSAEAQGLSSLSQEERLVPSEPKAPELLAQSALDPLEVESGLPPVLTLSSLALPLQPFLAQSVSASAPFQGQTQPMSVDVPSALGAMHLTDEHNVNVMQTTSAMTFMQQQKLALSQPAFVLPASQTAFSSNEAIPEVSLGAGATGTHVASSTAMWRSEPLQATNASVLGQQLMKVLADKAELQVGLGIQRAVIRLDPPSLGTVELTIALEGEKLSVHLNSPAAQTRELLAQGLEQLRQQLQQKLGVEVALQTGDGHSGQRGDTSQSQTGISTNHDWRDAEVDSTEQHSTGWLNQLV